MIMRMKGYDWSVRCGDMILAVHNIELFKQGQSHFILKTHEAKKITVWNTMHRHGSSVNGIIDLIKSVDVEKGDFSNVIAPNAKKPSSNSEIELGSIDNMPVVAFWGEDDGHHFRELVISVPQLKDALEALNKLKQCSSENL